MPKIDCSITENFLKELNRMTNTCCIPCAECAISYLYNRNKKGCADAIMRYSEEAISLVQEWSDAHPVKTRLDDLKEKYPNFRMDIYGTYPAYYPHLFGYCSNCCTCVNVTKFNKGNDVCWNEPLEGGATGA